MIAPEVAIIVGLCVGLAVAVVMFWAGIWRGYRLSGRLREALEHGRQMHARKDEAYKERNMLVAYFAATIMNGTLEGWRVFRGWDAHFKGWETCLYIEPPPHLGVGQLCWHFPEKDKWLVDGLHLPMHPTGWDKRSREEKYASMCRFVALIGGDL